jgi:hypothetical protein
MVVVYYAALGAKVQNFSLCVVLCLILVSTSTELHNWLLEE